MNEKAVLTDDELYDQSRRAQHVLDSILHGQIDGTGAHVQDGSIDARAARHARPVTADTSTRASTRVLFVTTDQTVLVEHSTTRTSYASLASVFDEVHVMVLVPRAGNAMPAQAAERTWVYPVFAPHWWQLPFRARTLARDALVFHDSVRPDLVVAVEPYEAGLGAYLIARTFDRPLQVHVPEDFTADSFKSERSHGAWLARIARFVLKRAPSVRARTDRIKEMLSSGVARTTDIEVLPRFHNFTGYLSATPSFDVHDTYRDYVFITLAFAPLVADGHLQDVFTALHNTLHNPRIGLIIVDDGPARDLYAEKARLLGIERNVVFLKRADDPVSLFKTADLLIEADISEESETHVMRAAAAGLPILAAETPLRTDLFDDGVSAFLYPPGDYAALAQKFTKFINQPALRKQFARTGQQVAKERLIEDPTAYYRAYRDSIEVALGPDEQPTPVSENIQKQAETVQPSAA